MNSAIKIIVSFVVVIVSGLLMVIYVEKRGIGGKEEPSRSRGNNYTPEEIQGFIDAWENRKRK